MKVRSNSLEAKDLSWFIDLLNSERRPESPRLGAGEHLPLPSKKIRRKLNSWMRREASRPAERARSLAASHMGEIVTNLNCSSPWTGSDEKALRDLRSDQGPFRKSRERAFRFDVADRLARRCGARFVHDKHGKVLARSTDEMIAACPEAPLLVDAMSVLARLVERGLHSRLKRCRGYLKPFCRGAAPRLCGTWFEKRTKKKYCTPECERRTERQRNTPSYNRRQLERALRLRQADAEAVSSDGRSRADRNALRRSPTLLLKSSPT